MIFWPTSRQTRAPAAIPVFIYGPLDVQYNRPNLNHDYPGIKFLVQPVDAPTLLQQLTGLPTPLSEAERAGMRASQPRCRWPKSLLSSKKVR